MYSFLLQYKFTLLGAVAWLGWLVPLGSLVCLLRFFKDLDLDNLEEEPLNLMAIICFVSLIFRFALLGLGPRRLLL